jgi:hypothetical protein
MAHWKSALPSNSSGGAATSGLGSLAVIFARVLREASAGQRGVYIGALAWQRGKRSNRIMEIFAVIVPGTASCSF